MKQILISIVFCGSFFISHPQAAPAVKKKFEKEIAVYFFVLYPDEYLPAVSLNIRKIITSSFKIGAGLSELYIRYLDAFYLPVYANFQSYTGKTKRLGININTGYGFLNNTAISNYAWGPGKVIVSRKGGYYLSFGSGYNFSIGNKTFKTALNYVQLSYSRSIFIEPTNEVIKDVEVRKAVSASIAYVF